MKKKILCIACFLLLSGCSTGVKSDKKLTCTLETKNEKAILKLKSEISYNEEADKPISGVLETSYSKLTVTPTTNSIFLSLKDRSSTIAQIDGVEVETTTAADGFTFIEKWNYEKVDVDKASSIDVEQAKFIQDNVYSLKKMQANFKMLNYSCKTESLKK